MRVFWEEVDAERAVFIEEPVIPAHPVNPLDIAENWFGMNPCSYCPIWFSAGRKLRRLFRYRQKRMVLLPKRIQERILNGNKN